MYTEMIAQRKVAGLGMGCSTMVEMAVMQLWSEIIVTHSEGLAEEEVSRGVDAEVMPLFFLMPPRCKIISKEDYPKHRAKRDVAAMLMPRVKTPLWPAGKVEKLHNLMDVEEEAVARLSPPYER